MGAEKPIKEGLGGFIWSPNDEPHATRRKEMLEKYPQIKNLFGPCPKTKYITLALVAFQLTMAILVRDLSWGSLLFLAYAVSGTLNHWLMMAVHEFSHNLGFTKVLPNRIFGVIANIGMALPSAITFKRYHMEHHRYQGEDVIDVDIPTVFEGELFQNAPMKVIFVFLMPFLYAFRPLVTYPKKVVPWEIANFIIVAGAMVLLYNIGGWKSIFYLMFGTILGAGMHPVAGHFIAEHYVFVKGYETYSYYGPLNMFTFNVGYHNEHHDFPYIPGSRLPLVRKIAPEYYDNLPQHSSWVGVIWRYITDDSIGPFSRIKRKTLSSKEKESLKSK